MSGLSRLQGMSENFLVLGIPAGTIVPEIKVPAATEPEAQKLKAELSFSHPKNWSWKIIRKVGEALTSIAAHSEEEAEKILQKKGLAWANKGKSPFGSNIIYSDASGKLVANFDKNASSLGIKQEATMGGLARMKQLTEEMLEPIAGEGDADASDAVLSRGGAVRDPDVARQPELASTVMLVIPAPKASTIHKSFDEMEGALREFLSSVMTMTKDIADAAVSAEADESEIRVSWTVNPEDVGRFISIAKNLPVWRELQNWGASFQADK